jgi:hypothetical protein
VRRNLLLAGVLGAVAAATRNLGVILLIPLLFEWLRYWREFGLRGLADIALIPAGLLGTQRFCGAASEILSSSPASSTRSGTRARESLDHSGGHGAGSP